MLIYIIRETCILTSTHNIVFRKACSLKQIELDLQLQSPSSLHAALIAAPPVGLIHHQNLNRTNKQIQQPPRPELRSDSFARAETLLKEYRLFNNFLTESINVQNNSHESKETIPGSREVYKIESEDAGLLTVVDQGDSLKITDESHHLQSLTDVSSLHGSPTTNQIAHVNLVSPDTSIINTMISTTNSTPNQSPNAWQSSVQVCRILHCFFTSLFNFCFFNCTNYRG